ncbi:restriction endonuclease subunit S [Selenomonas ruminantium]|uniref:restriction endonuclease subunit S n=1 Tax=Selenomonas ruminantium TaxID=971 RepID=UPI00047DB716|nr:restriction endonuclease subunit S [Selenomonas ruminantium]
MNAQQLKNSILQRAIEGRLVPQRPEEGSAKELLEKIQEEKNRLIAEKKIKKSKPLPPISDDEKPFDIPDSWEWVRFDEFGVYKKGPFGSALTKSMFVPKGIDTIKVYEQKNAIQKDATLGNYYISRKYFEEKMTGFEVKSGDIIVSCAGTIGETYILPDGCETGIINQALMRMKLMPSVYVPFFLLYFDSILKNTARKSSKGSALKNIPPFAELKSYLVPLPPLAEQQRIMEKIEELLPLIDQYDKAHTKLTAFNKRFPEMMKKSILQYAIEGKLVEQRKEEGTADELLQQIQAEKKQLIEEKKLKETKPLPPITEDEIPFDIPDTWKWIRLDDIVVKDIKRGKAPSYINKSNTLVFAQKCNTKEGSINLELAKCLDEAKLIKYPANEFMLNEDIIVNSTGTGTMGRVGLYRSTDNPKNLPIVPDSHVTIIRPSNSISHKYIYAVLKHNQAYLEKQGEGSTNQKELKPLTLQKLLIPLPPLNEQHRIVAKIEELLPFCERLIK